MQRKGKYFDITLKNAHLKWGTESSLPKKRERSEYEAYLPISMENARNFNIRTGEIFESFSADTFFEGRLKATGSQGKFKEYGKNLYKERDLRALGYWLKDRMKAEEGDTVRVEFIDENSIKLSFIKVS